MIETTAVASSYFNNSGFDHRDQDREESRDFEGDGSKPLNDDGAVTIEPPTQPSFIADHCYGLPYQDHNYGVLKTQQTQQRNYSNENYAVPGNKPDQQYQLSANNNSQGYSSTNSLTIIAPPLERNSFGDEDEAPTTVEIFSPAYSGNDGSSSRPNDNKSPLFFQPLNSVNNYNASVGQQQFLQKSNGDVEVATSSSSGIITRPSRPRQPSNTTIHMNINNVPSNVVGNLVNFEDSSSSSGAVSHSYAAAAPTALGATATVLRQSLSGKTAQPLRRPLGMPPAFSSHHQFPMTKQQQFAMVIQQQHQQQQQYEQQQRSCASRVLTTPAGSVTSVNLLTPDRDHTTHGHQNQYNALTGQSDVMLSSSILNNSPPLNYHMDHHLHHQQQHHSTYADPNSYSQPAHVDYNNNPNGQNYAMRHMAPMQPPPPGQMATDVKRAGRPRGGRPTFYAPPNQQAAVPMPNNGQAPPPRRMAPIVVGPAQAAQSRRQNSGSLPYNYAVQPGVGPTFYNGSTAQMQTIASGRIVQQGPNQYMDDGLPVVPIDLPEDPSCSDNFDFSGHHGGTSNAQHEAAMNANGLISNLSSGHPLQQQQSSFQQQTTTVNNNNDIFGDQCRSMFDRLFKELGVENDAEAASRAATAVAELNELAKANKIDQAAEERFIKKYRRQLQDMARKRRLAVEGATPAKKPPKPKKPKKEPSSSTTTKPKKSSTTTNQRGRPPKTSKKDQDATIVPLVKKEESLQDDSDQDSQESDGEIADHDDEKQERIIKAIAEQHSSSQQKIKATVDQLQAAILAKDRLRKKSEKSTEGEESEEEEGELKSEKETSEEEEDEEEEHKIEDEESDEAATEESENENEWEGQDYTTSCLCGMTHNDDFMIQCDKCEVWQHCDCMGLKKRSIPDKYLCHVCKPRILLLTKEKARKLQAKKMAEMKAKRQAQKKKNNSQKRKATDGKKSSSSQAKLAASKKIVRKRQNLNTKLEHRKLLLQRLLSRNAAVSSAKSKTIKKEESTTTDTTSEILADQTPMSKAKRREMLRNQKETFDEFYAAFTAVDVNEYSEDVLEALREESDTLGASLLDQLPMGAPCLAMYVTKERRGLVANLTIPPDQPIFEYRGKFFSISEFSGRDVDGYILPYVLFYRCLQKGDGSLSPKLDLCVDARFKGTDARFIRRSCQPNTQVKHVIKNGELHLLIISTELIESATEVTIPFDYDFRSCKYNVECACKVLSDDECPIERSNAERRAAALAANSRSTSPCPAPPSAAVPPSIPKSKQKSAGVNILPRGKYAPKKSKIKEATTTTTESKQPPKKKDEEETKKQKPKFKLGFKIKLKEKKKTENKKEQVEENSAAQKSSQAKKKTATEKKTPNRKRLNSTLKSEESFTSPPIKKDKISEETGDDNEHDAREEKKMRQLLEQIARMEEREKRRKTTPKSRSNSCCEEKVLKSEEFSSPKKEVAVESSFSTKSKTENATPTTAPPRSDSVSSSTNVYTDTESYVAKKRWLRQALSEGISSRTNSEENQTGQNITGFSSPIFNMMSPNSTDRQPLHPSISENIFESNQPFSTNTTGENNSSEIETELITTSINVTMDECVLGDLLGGSVGAADSRPSSSADSSTPVQTEGEQIDQKQQPKKKVRMSLDEYKKRKRDVPGETSGVGGAETTPTQQAAIGGGENSNDGMSGGDGSTTPSSSSNVAVDSSGRSFIPHLKESDLYAQPIRLGSLPDPRLIGRGSTSLEDLRKRIYGRTINYANYQADGATEPNSASRNADPAADAETGDGSQQRMSLMDRLKNEFGLDDHA